METATVSTELQFTDDELAQLHLLLAQDMEITRIELHHTAGLPYREYLKQHLEQGGALLKKMEDAHPTLHMASAG
jgi:hypothetical protein